MVKGGMLKVRRVIADGGLTKQDDAIMSSVGLKEVCDTPASRNLKLTV